MAAKKAAGKSYRGKAKATNAKPWDFRPFEVVQPNVIFNGPVPTHWAMLYIDESGNIGEMSNLPVLIFDARARNAFAEAHGLVPPHDTYNSGSRFGMGHSKRRRTGPRNDNPFDAQNIEEFENSSEQFPIEIGNRKQVSAFYESGFRRLQQINCRLLAKSFIKVIEPRKQVKHPYNGGKGAAPGQKGDPEKTKPDWWPRDVMHREPDHIRKELRLKLLVHLVQNLLPMGITAEMLEDAADDTRRHLQPEDQRAIRALIVDEIFRVRKIEERFERNEIDGTTQVYVSDHDGAKNGEPQSDDEEEEKEERGEEEEERSGVLTPPATVTSSPHMQQLEVSPRAMDLVTIPDHISPMGTSPSFQMPTDLNFTNPAHNPTEFTCTQPEMSHTVQPLTTSMLTPNHNQFLDPASFGEPGPANQLQAVGVHDPSHTPNTPSTPSFTGWSPSFQQNMFSPVVYPGGVDRQMSSHMGYPYGQFSSPQDMAPTFAMPEVSRSREFDVTNMYHLPFRTGSLGHPHVLPRRNSEAEHRM